MTSPSPKSLFQAEPITKSQNVKGKDLGLVTKFLWGLSQSTASLMSADFMILYVLLVLRKWNFSFNVRKLKN